MNPTGDDLAGIAELSSLDDPVRRRLYDYVAARPAPVTRDAAAAAVGVGRSLVAYHLDKLVDARILAVSYEHRSDRRGPGAGRPAKYYSLAREELSVSVPPRSYGLLAALLAEAVAADETGAVGAAVAGAARRYGSDNAAGGSLIEALGGYGYQPVPGDDGVITLRNCPFDRIATEHPELVCELNLQLIQGMLEALGEDTGCATLAPATGRCCVVLRP